MKHYLFWRFPFSLKFNFYLTFYVKTLHTLDLIIFLNQWKEQNMVCVVLIIYIKNYKYFRKKENVHVKGDIDKESERKV